MLVARGLFVSLFAALVWTAGCNAFRSPESCDVDTDCGRGTVCAKAAGYCRTGSPISLGVLLPVTGNQASLTPVRLQGIRFGEWLVDRDPERRVLNRGLSFVVEDTLSDVTQVSAATSRLFDKNVLAIVGPASSPEVSEAQALTFSRNMIEIAPAAGATVLGPIQPGGLGARYLFQLSPEIGWAMRTLPLFLELPPRPVTYDVCYDGIAVVVTDDATGGSYATSLNSLLPQDCIPVTATLTVPRDKKGDYSAEIKALADAHNGAAKTRCIFMSVRPDVAGEMLRALKAYEKVHTAPPYSAFFGSSLLHTPTFVDEAKSAVANEPSLAEGFHGFDVDDAPERAAFRDLQALWPEYLAAHPDEEDLLDVGGDRPKWAEPVVLLGLAIEQAGTTDDPVLLRDALIDIAQPGDDDLVVGPKEIGDAVARIRAARASGRRAGIDYRGAVSNYDFDDGGFVTAPRAIWRVHKGAIERFVGFSEEEVVAAKLNPGPACARKPR